MHRDHHPSQNDYWASEFEPGTSSTWRFSGRDGLARLTGPATFASSPPEEFRAQLTRVQLDHVALEAFESSAHIEVRAQEEIEAHPTPLLYLVLLVAGQARFEVPDARFDLTPGQYVVIDNRQPSTMRFPARSRVVRAVVGLEHLPHRLQREGATIPGPLPRTALSDSYTAFITNILTTTASGREARGHQLVQAIADLTSAVLAEAQQLNDDRGGPAGLRYRIEQYIEDHYTEPDLGPQTIAAAFDISLRHAHGVFNDDDQTLARFIRDRRVAAVAIELRASRNPVRFDTLATRYGFSSRDVLARAFRDRFGMTLGEYRDGGHRHLG